MRELIVTQSINARLRLVEARPFRSGVGLLLSCPAGDRVGPA
jgi:hypothetical protein